jgi:transcription elongation factor GreB
LALRANLLVAGPACALRCAAMSKAFTRESDDLPERPSALRPVSALPPGAKNYLTADGAQRMREELDRLLQTERPQAGQTPDPEEARRLLAGLDQRGAFLNETLRTAVVVPAPPPPHDKVLFGATVTVRQQDGAETCYRIVGVDETDIDRGWVSWCSPIARALLNARLGQSVRFRFPSGEERLEIVAIVYS